jgi:hypothetical protein
MQLDTLIRLWMQSIDPNFNIYWIIGLGLFAVLVPMCWIKDISKFNKLHIVGDIAVVAVVLTLAITSIYDLSSGQAHGHDFVAVTPDWPITLGMSVTMMEGIALVLPIKVICIFI